MKSAEFLVIASGLKSTSPSSDDFNAVMSGGRTLRNMMACTIVDKTTTIVVLIGSARCDKVVTTAVRSLSGWSIILCDVLAADPVSVKKCVAFGLSAEASRKVSFIGQSSVSKFPLQRTTDARKTKTKARPTILKLPAGPGLSQASRPRSLPESQVLLYIFLINSA